MNTLDKQYIDLLHAINEYGVVKEDRTGTGTRSIFGYTIRHNMQEGFPLLTTKKMAWKSIVTELLWFLRGDTNTKFLVDNNCHIWDGDCYQAYIKRYNKGEYVGKTKLLENSKKNRTLTEPFTQEEFINQIKTDDEFAKKWGDLGPIYGKQWRSWSRNSTRDEKIVDPGVYTKQIDQIANLINDLKTNPDSRRLIVNAWNVGELDQMVLPPCHYGFQVYTRELSESERFNWYGNKIGSHMHHDHIEQEMNENNVPKRAISLMWNQRSVDTFLGLPFNIASYGLLLTMIADEVNMLPNQLIGNLGDVHLYLNHEAAVEEQIGRCYSPDERTDLLKKAMGEDTYSQAVSELMPFGGGLSFEYEHYKIPRRTREPFKLPTVHVRDGIHCSSINDIILENYQSHPAIKAPLSN
jgi:thymidylate synthase